MPKILNKSIASRNYLPPKIKSMNIEEYAFVFGKAVKTGRVVKNIKYDENGNMLPKDEIPDSKQYISTQTHSDAVIVNAVTKSAELWTMKFSGNQNIVKSHWYGESAQYVSKGNNEAEVSDAKNKDSAVWKIKFDPNGRKIEEIEYLPSGKIRTKLLHKFDVNGTKVEDQEYSVYGAHITKYNNLGNEVVETWYDLLDEPKLQWMYSYEYF